MATIMIPLQPIEHAGLRHGHSGPYIAAPDRAVYVRRRLAAVLLLALLFSLAFLGGRVVLDAPGGLPASTAVRGQPAAAATAAATLARSGGTYVVQPGDSLWSIAARLEPGRDPRPLVDALAGSRGGAPLVPGEVINRPR